MLFWSFLRANRRRPVANVANAFLALALVSLVLMSHFVPFWVLCPISIVYRSWCTLETISTFDRMHLALAAFPGMASQDVTFGSTVEERSDRLIQSPSLTLTPLGIWISVRVGNRLLTVSLYPIIFVVRKVNWSIWKSVTERNKLLTVTNVSVNDRDWTDGDKWCCHCVSK